MLSITIIALSIIIPTPRIRPERDIILILIPIMYNDNMLIVSDVGMLMIISNGARKSRKKKNIMNMANKLPYIKLCCKLSIEKSIV